MENSAKTLAAWAIAATVLCAWPGTAGADGYRGAPFSAEAWFGSDGALELRYKMYVSTRGYRLEAVEPIEGPDIIVAQFAVPQFVYIDLDTGSINFLPMGENDWGRFHGVACADFEYRKKLGAAEVAGRTTEVWQCIGSTRLMGDARIWWDRALGYQLRSDEQGYVTELRNIMPGEPDAALFDTSPARN